MSLSPLNLPEGCTLPSFNVHQDTVYAHRLEKAKAQPSNTCLLGCLHPERLELTPTQLLLLPPLRFCLDKHMVVQQFAGVPTTAEERILPLFSENKQLPNKCQTTQPT